MGRKPHRQPRKTPVLQKQENDIHTLGIIIVEAEDADDAAFVAEEFVDTVNWSDWSEIGGRWADLIEGKALRYTDNPEKFMEIIQRGINSRKHHFDELLAAVGNLTVGELATDPTYNLFGGTAAQEAENEDERNKRIDRSLALYRANRLLELAGDQFTPDTHYFDTASGSTKVSYLMERIQEGDPNKQWVVIWDFHH